MLGGFQESTMRKNVRLEDIAKELNLTKVSISKALRDHPDISKDTRKRVKEMARKLGYRPNAVARSLTSAKSKMIGVVIPKMAHFFFSSVMESIHRVAYDSGYEVIIGVSFESEELEKKHIETMLEMRVDGILVSLSEETKKPDIFEEVRKLGINLVFFDRGFTDAGFSYIQANDRKSTYMGVKHLIEEEGATEIAHLAGYRNVNIGRDRRLGYEDALKDANMTIPENGVIEGGFSEEDGYEGFKKMLDSYGVPKFLFTVTYPVGLGALQCMREHNIDPADITVLTFGKSDFNKYLSNPFKCIDQPTFEMGEKAFNRLLFEINSEEEVKPELIQLNGDVS